MKYLIAMLVIPVGLALAPTSPLFGVMLVILGALVTMRGLYTGDLPLFGSKR